MVDEMMSWRLISGRGKNGEWATTHCWMFCQNLGRRLGLFSAVFYLLWCLHFLFACVVGAPTIVAADAEAAAAVFSWLCGYVCICVCVYVSRLIVVCIGVWPLASYGHSKVFFRAIDVVIAANVVLFVYVCVYVCKLSKRRRKQANCQHHSVIFVRKLPRQMYTLFLVHTYNWCCINSQPFTSTHTHRNRNIHTRMLNEKLLRG